MLFSKVISFSTLLHLLLLAVTFNLSNGEGEGMCVCCLATGLVVIGIALLIPSCFVNECCSRSWISTDFYGMIKYCIGCFTICALLFVASSYSLMCIIIILHAWKILMVRLFWTLVGMALTRQHLPLFRTSVCNLMVLSNTELRCRSTIKVSETFLV